MKRTAILVTALFLSAGPLCRAENRGEVGQAYTPEWQSLDLRPVPEWFQDAKFGIFVHWGLYSVPAYSPTVRDGMSLYDLYAEHYWNRWVNGQMAGNSFFREFHSRVYGNDFSYRDFAGLFKAEVFNPAEWAEIFRTSGAKYVVLTSKHHEGFCLWPSAFSPEWNAGESGPHRDLLGELTDAVRQAGLRMGYYYSLLEWFHPLYNTENIEEYTREHLIPQMKELVCRYNPDILWTDGEWDHPSGTWHSEEFLQWLYNDSPVRDRIAVNDRWGSDTRSRHGGFFTTEYDIAQPGIDGLATFARPWEECRGIGGSFGFNRMERLEDYASSQELIRLLVQKVSHGGNLLLNIGPTADGRIPLLMQERLKDMGDWLSVNGEAIYGSRKWSNAEGSCDNPDVFFTSKKGAVYAIATKWISEPLEIKGIGKVTAVSLLGGTEKVSFKRKGNSIIIRPVHVKSPDALPCKWAWTFRLLTEMEETADNAHNP